MAKQQNSNQGSAGKSEATQETPNPAEQQSAPQDQTADLETRAADLDERERKVQERESALAEKEQSMAEQPEKPVSAKAGRGETPDFLKPDYSGPLDTRQAKRRLAFKQSAEGRKLYADHEKASK